jgi:hypothetical protein
VRFVVHYCLHLLLPIGLARVLDRTRWLQVAATLLATMVVDLDHLVAEPIYDPGRCSVGFHPLHTGPAAAVYAAMLLLPRPWRYVGLGLLMHLAADGLDCIWMRSGG